ncbi:hypothetical protein MYP_3466 [Sporocytophaga myxococcoides]|uniref:Uncharacterized protein n=1 Tax=Sporocytophaga myxococcoides TaxID=153721 RepID=A0A098LIN8_9BACT|nr:hypothetical protein MYP_3466 [Sporocytophaga myxococcoides]
MKIKRESGSQSETPIDDLEKILKKLLKTRKDLRFDLSGLLSVIKARETAICEAVSLFINAMRIICIKVFYNNLAIFFNNFQYKWKVDKKSQFDPFKRNI